MARHDQAPTKLSGHFAAKRRLFAMQLQRLQARRLPTRSSERKVAKRRLPNSKHPISTAVILRGLETYRRRSVTRCQGSCCVTQCNPPTQYGARIGRLFQTATVRLVVFASPSQEPLVWQFLGVVALVVVGLSVLGGLAGVISSPFVKTRNRKSRVEEAQAKGGQEAVDRYIESSERYREAQRQHVKKAVLDGVAGDNNLEKFIGLAVLGFVVVAAIIAATR